MWRKPDVGYAITVERLTGLEGSERVVIVGNCSRAATVEEVAAKIALMGEAARRRVEQNNAVMQAKMRADEDREREEEARIMRETQHKADAKAALKTVTKLKG